MIMGRTRMTPLNVPGNGRRPESSSAETSPGSVTLDTVSSKSPVLDLRPQGPYDAGPKRPLAVARGLLGRLVPGRVSRSRARESSRSDAEAGKALQVALKLAPVGQPTGGPAAVRSASVPTSAPPRPIVSGQIAPLGTRTGAHALAPTTPEATHTAALDLRAAPLPPAWAAQRAVATALSPTPDGAPGGRSPASHRRGAAGETAPDFLLRAPSSVAQMSEDFFDGLVRHVEDER